MKMSAKERIEGLTNAWYGFALFGAISSILKNGFGIFSLGLTIMSLIFTLAVTFFIGRSLIKRSSFMRTIMLVLSVVAGLLGAFWTFKSGTQFLGQWSFGALIAVVTSAAGVMMNVRSFRVLTDSSVKSYFG
jgi:hypothetical protein